MFWRRVSESAKSFGPHIVGVVSKNATLTFSNLEREGGVRRRTLHAELLEEPPERLV